MQRYDFYLNYQILNPLFYASRHKKDRFYYYLTLCTVSTCIFIHFVTKIPLISNAWDFGIQLVKPSHYCVSG